MNAVLWLLACMLYTQNGCYAAFSPLLEDKCQHRGHCVRCTLADYTCARHIHEGHDKLFHSGSYISLTPVWFFSRHSGHIRFDLKSYKQNRKIDLKHKNIKNINKLFTLTHNRFTWHIQVLHCLCSKKMFSNVTSKELQRCLKEALLHCN